MEINLTSNDQILGVRGADHPFPVYRAAGVPTVLSTDDEGVERIDRTHELQRAVTEFGLDWPTLGRSGAQYAGIRVRGGRQSVGRSGGVAQGGGMRRRRYSGAAPGSCAALLQGSEKARLQWELERDLGAFGRESR